MVRLITIITAITALALLAGLSGCIKKRDTAKAQSYYEKSPEQILLKRLEHNGQPLRPTRLQLLADTLFVSYVGQAKIDLYDSELALIRTIELDDPEPVYPTSFAVTDSMIIVIDHAKRVVVRYDRDGKYIESFGTLPDGTTKLSPFSLTYYGGVAYVGDLSQQQVLAISMVDAKELTQPGELILGVPGDTTRKIGFPSAVYVTFEGRLFIGNADRSMVEVYTCDGRYIYDFDSVATLLPMAPMGFDTDWIIDSTMIDSTSFDPSGIRSMGRIHLVDANNGAIHMFNPLGKYISSYPNDRSLVRPSSIAIDRFRGKVYIADPQTPGIFVYSYGE